jgi:hypothetical protein
MEIFDRTSQDGSAQSKAPWAGVFGAFILALLNMGQFIKYDPSISILSLDVKDTKTLFMFSLFLFGPIYSWYLVKLSRVTNTFLGFYLGASTVSLLQFFSTMALISAVK